MRKPGEFRMAQQRGRRAASAHFVVFSYVRDQPQARLGITVSRKVGSAVVRNRVKRIVREVFRRQCRSLRPCDVVVIARAGAGDRPRAELAAELQRLLAEIGRDASR